MAYDKKALNAKGCYVAPDDEAFLKANSNPWEAEASGHGYNARFSDDDGWKRGEQSRSGLDAWQSRGGDDLDWQRPSQDRTDESGDRVHQELYRLIDNQVDLGSGNKMTGGGGPVSENKVGGVGDGKIRHPVKTGPQGNMRKPR
jgi:hypothetical protein